MKTIQIDNSLVCYDDYDIDNKPELKQLIQTESLKKILDSVKQDITLVLWWDGTMLRAIRDNHLSNRPFLGINFWTLGFLLNDKNWITERTKSFTYRNYPLLEVKKDWEVLWVWFNDVNIYSPTGKMIEIDLELQNSGHINLRWDWVLISTPAWSTGHSKSHSGNILPHSSENLVITPKWNLTPEHPKTIENSIPVIIKNTGRKHELWVNLDGAQAFTSHYEEDVVLEIYKSSQSVQLLIAQEHEVDWDAKVMEQQWFKR